MVASGYLGISIVLHMLAGVTAVRYVLWRCGGQENIPMTEQRRGYRSAQLTKDSYHIGPRGYEPPNPYLGFLEFHNYSCTVFIEAP
jgi:hypothetical protein